MDIYDHPPIPLAQNNCPLWQFPSYFSTVFSVLNLRHTFPTSYRTPKFEIVCKSYDHRKLTIQLTTLGPQTL